MGNPSNIVAVVACWPGAALASKVELKGRRPWLLRWLPVAAAGGAAGAALLLSTSAGVFVKVVPFLVAAGSVTLLAQPKLAARRERRQACTDGPLLSTGALLPTGLVGLSVYNGYFGAGSGEMALALVLLTVDGDLPRANALKNMVIGAATLVAAIGLIVFGSVDWKAVVPLAIGWCLASRTPGPGWRAVCQLTSYAGWSHFSASLSPSSCLSIQDPEPSLDMAADLSQGRRWLSRQ